MRWSVLAVTSAFLLATTAGAAEPAALPEANPFAAPSSLPWQAPPFDRIRDEHYEPAFAAGMREHLAEVQRIANQKEAPTFANTIEAMERSGQLLNRVSAVFFAIAAANTSKRLQAIQARVAPELAAHSDAIHLDPALFARIRSLHETRDTLDLKPQQRVLVERYYRDFVHAGAQLAEADKARLRELNREESSLSTAFEEKLLAATRAGALVVHDRKALAGLDEASLAAAAEAAKERGEKDAFVIPLQNTTQQPDQAFLSDRGTREKLFRASTLRAERGDDHDTRAVVQRLAELRAEKARLLGFANYASWNLQDQMAKTPEAALKLLTDTVPAATARARGEAARMQRQADGMEPPFKLAPWDWQYMAEQVRKAEYDLDEAQIKPYLELGRVLKDGVFHAASQLYGLRFKERKDIPVYAEGVQVFEVFDHDGTPLALFYGDWFSREGKQGGAWMDNFVGQSHLLGTRPVVFNVCNFAPPAKGQPALLGWDDVITLFHEFGHALHGMFSDVEYPTLSGTNVPRDFVEFPSQFNEHWASEPTVFAHYARHHETGEPMPPELVAKIQKAATFNQGFATTEYLAAALLDMAWHTLPPDAGKQDVDAFERAALKRYRVDLPLVPPRYRSTYFSHIWGGGYAAGYYAYFWSEVLDHDTWYWFRENGGLSRANGQRFRDMVLARGSSEDLGAMYRAFRGKDPSVQPLLEQRGLAGAGGGT